MAVFYRINPRFTGNDFLYAIYRYGRYPSYEEFKAPAPDDDITHLNIQRLYPTTIGNFEFLFRTNTDIYFYNKIMDKTYDLELTTLKHFHIVIINTNNIWDEINS